MTPRAVQATRCKVRDSHTPLRLADGARSVSRGFVKSLSLRGVDRHGGAWKYRGPFHVLDFAKFDLLLGMPFCARLEPRFYWKQRTWALPLPPTAPLIPAQELDVRKMEEGDAVFMVQVSEVEDPPLVQHVVKDTGDALRESVKDALAELLKRFSTTFPDRAPDTLPDLRPGFDLRVALTPEGRRGRPFAKKPYRLSPRELEVLRETIKQQRAAGHIVPSKSAWGAPVLFVRKADGSLRMCIDYRGLNSVTVRNNYPLPRMDELVDRLAGASWFTTLDLWGAYNQLRVHPDDEHLTTFVTSEGAYQYRVCPFGLTNCPAAFSTFVSEIFGDLIGKGVLVYLDDIVIYSETQEENVELLEKVLEVLQKHKLVCKLKKCDFLKQEVDYVGFSIGKNGVSPQYAKVAPIQEMPYAKCVLDIKRFLGMLGFYSMWIQNYAKIALPLTDCLRTGAFKFGHEERDAWDALKRAISQSPILKLPDHKKPFTVRVDTCKRAVGAVLEQEYEDGMHPVAFISEKLPILKQKVLAAHELELYGLYFALKRWRMYLEGAMVTVYTDHRSLVNIREQKDLSRKQARILEYLESHYHLIIRWCKGQLHASADCLSRNVAPVFEVQSVDEHLQGLRAKYLKRGEFFGTVLRDVEANGARQPRYKLEGERLYLKEGDRLCIPDDKDLKLEIFRQFHDSVVGSHAGSRAMLAFIRRTYFWPRMSSEIERYVQTCNTCASYKHTTTAKATYLQAMQRPCRPFQSCSLDMVDYPMSTLGHDSAIVVVCRFSKFCIVIPRLRTDTTGDTIHRLMSACFSLFGMPQELISDRDSLFTAQEYQEHCFKHGIKLCMTTAGRAQADGQTERTIRTISEALRLVVNGREEEWENVLPLVQLGYNSRVHSATGETPFFAATGRDPFIPGVLEKPRNNAPGMLSSIWAQVHDNLTKSETQMMHQENTRRRPRSFKVGDLVWLSTANLRFRNAHAKFKPRFVGKFEVLADLGKGQYQLRLPPSLARLQTDVFNVDLLRRVTLEKSGEFEGRGTQEPAPFVLEGREEFEVDRILDAERREDEQIWVKVRWQGYSEKHDSWEPAAWCSNAQDRLDECPQYKTLVEAATRVARHRELTERDAQRGPRPRRPTRHQRRSGRDGEYEVYRVLDANLDRQGTSIWVKIWWKGYPQEQATWEPESACANAQELMDACQAYRDCRHQLHREVSRASSRRDTR